MLAVVARAQELPDDVLKIEEDRRLPRRLGRGVE
jgi:hypothetical protein